MLNAYGASNRETLANALGRAPQDLNSALAIGVHDGLVSTGADSWDGDPEAFWGSFAVTPVGRVRYERILVRSAQQIATPDLSIPDRCLLACANDQATGLAQRLTELADDPRLTRVQAGTGRSSDGNGHIRRGARPRPSVGFVTGAFPKSA